MTQRMQVWRLEYDDTDTNSYKQYTVLANSQHCIFGYSRIGGTWQITLPSTPDPMGKARSQMSSKRRGGYSQVWNADVDLPDMWAVNPVAYRDQIQDLVEQLYRLNATSGGATGHDPANGRSEEPLGDLLSTARDLVGKVAVNPDKHVAEYASLVGQFEATKDAMDVAEGYIDTLRILLAETGKET